MYFYFFNECPLKMMKNTFYFISKVLFVVKVFKFLPWLFGNVEKNGLIRKIRLILNLWCHNPLNKQLISILTLPDISESKCNQAMKCGQLIQRNKRKTFFKKHTGNEAGRLVPKSQDKYLNILRTKRAFKVK